jgi:predicted phosphodiesterase
MDNLRRSGRDVLFQGFLDHVQAKNGQLIILGDFLELLRYPLDNIIVRRRDLLDRLAAMKALYVAGNHDGDISSLIDKARPPHPFFAGLRDPFTQRIGTRRFRFMHGHEIDPLMNAGWKNVGRMIGAMTYHFELRHDGRLLQYEWPLDSPLVACDPVVRLRRRLRRSMSKALHEGRVRTSAERFRLLTRQIRTQRMITHYYDDRADDLYDVAVAGHTHYAASFGDWFFNSGSWTGRTNNFLVISPAGQVNVLDWTHQGPLSKDEILAA